ncbi:MAG: nitroreductase family deazaflavin-dependent oxidoreductase [Dehalococcoidia bacterium]
MTTEKPKRPPWHWLISPIASSGPGASFFRRTLHLLDRPLMRLTGGRVSSVTGYPSLLLTTTGARSGEPRTVPLLYVGLGDRLGIIGSRFGSTKHPGWYHNLRADPRATVEIQGKRGEYTARPADDDERAEIWSRGVKMYPGYDKYKSRAGRKIPVMVLEPAPERESPAEA